MCKVKGHYSLHACEYPSDMPYIVSVTSTVLPPTFIKYIFFKQKYIMKQMTQQTQQIHRHLRWREKRSKRNVWPEAYRQGGQIWKLGRTQEQRHPLICEHTHSRDIQLHKHTVCDHGTQEGNPTT